MQTWGTLLQHAIHTIVRATVGNTMTLMDFEWEGQGPYAHGIISGIVHNDMQEVCRCGRWQQL